MLRTARYLVAAVALTGWHGMRIVLAAARGEKPGPESSYDREPRRWARNLLRVTGIEVTVDGLDRLEPGTAYVFCANHASFVDIWVLLAHLPGTVRFVAKQELFRIPIFGWALASGGQIAIDRHNRKSAFSAYDEAAAAMRRGMSAIVFVEGTRSRDGRLQDFKKGPFVLAIAAQAPVVPVYIEGAWRVLPRGSVRPRRHPVHVHLGDAIPTARLGYDDRDRLVTATRESMLAMRHRYEPAYVDAPRSGH